LFVAAKVAVEMVRNFASSDMAKLFWTKLHCVLISSPLSPSQKARETNPNREQKKAAVLENKII